MYDNMNQQQQQGGFGFNVNEYEAQAPIENLPVGWYNALISEAENEQTSSGKGMACKVVYTVFGGPYDGRKVFDNLNFINENAQAQDIARRAIRTIQDSIGKAINGPWDMINSYICIKVGLSKPQEGYEQRNQVKGYKPFDQALHAQNQQPAAQQYNVQVQPGMAPMGNGPMNMQQPSPQFAQQSMPQQMQPHGQAPNPGQFQQQGMPNQQMPQQMPQQVQPQQQYAQQPNNEPQPGSAPGSQPGQMPTPPGQAMNAPGATGPAGQQSQPQVGPNAQQQVAPPATFAPQQGQQMQPQSIPNPPQGQAQQLTPNPQYAPEQQQQMQPQQMQQQQMQPQQNQQMPQPPQGNQTGNTPTPPRNW